MLVVLVFAAALVVYLLTLSNNYAWDGVAFALLSNQGPHSSPGFFVAEHLLYPATGWAWYGGLRLLGYSGDSLLPLQILNAAFGAGGVALTLLLARRWGLRWPLALAVAGLVGGSYGYWYHSTDVEDMIIAVTLTMAAFYLLARDSSPEAIGITAALGIAHHATAVLALPALLLGTWWRQPRKLLPTVVNVGVVLFFAYIVIGLSVLSFIAPIEFARWFAASPTVGVWGKLTSQAPWIAAKGFSGSILYLGGGPNLRALLAGTLEAGNLAAMAGFAAVASGTLAVLVATAFRWRRLHNRRAATLCLLWATPCAIFAAFWAPEDVQFWVPVVPPLALLAAMVAATASPRATSILAGAAAVIIVANAATALLPRHDIGRNTALAKALCLVANTQPQDLVVAPGWDWAGSYGPYFARRRVFAIIDAFIMQAGRDPTRLFAALNAQMATTWASGGRVYAARLFTLEPEDRAWLQRTTGLVPEAFSVARQEAFACDGEPVYELVGAVERGSP